MKRIVFFMMVLGFLFLVHNQAAQAQSAAAEAKPTATVAAAQDVNNKICPVIGNEISEGSKVTYEYEGKIYHFCCPMCIEEFKKDPQKYIKKIEEAKTMPSDAGVEKGMMDMKM